MRIKRSGSNFQPHLILFPMAVFCLLPFILIVTVSLTDEKTVLREGYAFFPSKLSFEAYKAIFKAPGDVLHAYFITLAATICGTSLGMLLSSTLAYAVSRRDYGLSRATSFYIFFTMLFSGGLVPWYILIVRTLQLKDSIFVLFIPYLVVPWFVMLMRTFFQSIPSSLHESATIDGASEYRIFLQIVLPLSKPMLATITLFYVLMYWNDYWLSLLFIERSGNISLQYLLYRILSSLDFLNSAMAQQAGSLLSNVERPALTARMAMAVIAAGPMLVVFPFFQKYFVRGLTVGSIKG